MNIFNFQNHIMMWCILIILILGITVFAFVNQRSFGRNPQGERLDRIKHSPHYYDGEFHNRHEISVMTSDENRFKGFMKFLFGKRSKKLRPDTPLTVIKTDLKNIDVDKNMIIWFGHSSYLMQISGKRILVDPVFHIASPVSFINKPFKGTNIYQPEDMPEIDYLVITHDHWDHLDYKTVMELKGRIDKVICPLGVGEHFEYWGFKKECIIELDWEEHVNLEKDFTFYCLPTRHFSGRGLTPNPTLWASFLLETPCLNVYIGGDGGYDTHYTDIGTRFPNIDFAILENGQYNEDWKYIHLMPQYMAQAAKDLKAKKIMTVHHSKYALARHAWDEPLKNEQDMIQKDSLNLIIPQIGEIVVLEK